MSQKMRRFWYLLNYEDLTTNAEKKELRDLYDELYEEFSEDDLDYIAIVWWG